MAVRSAEPLRTKPWDVLDSTGKKLHRYTLTTGVLLLAVAERFVNASVEREDGLKQVQR